MRLRLAKKIVKAGPVRYSLAKWAAALVRCGWVKYKWTVRLASQEGEWFSSWSPSEVES